MKYVRRHINEDFIDSYEDLEDVSDDETLEKMAKEQERVYNNVRIDEVLSEIYDKINTRYSSIKKDDYNDYNARDLKILFDIFKDEYMTNSYKPHLTLRLNRKTISSRYHRKINEFIFDVTFYSLNSIFDTHAGIIDFNFYATHDEDFKHSYYKLHELDKDDQQLWNICAVDDHLEDISSFVFALKFVIKRLYLINLYWHSDGYSLYKDLLKLVDKLYKLVLSVELENKLGFKTANEVH